MQKAHKSHPPGVTREFSRFAHTYGQYNIIQSKVVLELTTMIEQKEITTVLDVGCGSGAVYHALKAQGCKVENFIALDASEEMLRRHPDGNGVSKVCVDFNVPYDLALPKDTLVLSSSALQWSSDLDRTLSWLASLGREAYFAIFTSNTFKTLHRTAGVDSPIHSAERLESAIERHYHASCTIKEYRLSFDSTREMFRYIKKSGVSGGTRQLGYRETKRVMQAYPLSYLEFEVLFVRGISRLGGVPV